ncbi:Bug family tripartite tricarboxylate transporter substrate binding protein [Polaromonas eurypsychrophila]|uniref:MFS transporter n=1 Tax=Polaromonas eurypsychrophila TaxID=1614635 RepID=A0A916SR19_9BURK|nr:tripartite tricarboxylate transporter substrate binding protein [Polaromonas eurypsychrophila]GGB09448.1 MFS transporter [Polaromonas eurypsychrophila]
MNSPSTHRRATACLAAALTALLALPLPSQAQIAFPNKVIKLIVPVAPGGGADAVARMVSEKMSQSLGQPIIIENKAGASGSIAAMDVARAAPDGYTLMQCFVATHSTNPAVLKLKYDPIADFAPVGMMAQTSNVLVVSDKSKAKNLQEFLALARAKPGSLSFSSAGAGSATHLIMEYLENQAKVDLVHVPYKGAAPAMQDLLGGQVEAMFPSLTTALPHIKAGKLRALAVASVKRDPMLPDVSTVAEQGFAGFSAIQWWGLCAPAKTPEAVVARLNKALNDALALPDIQARLHEMAAEPTPVTPAQFGSFLKAEVIKWKKLVSDTGLQIEQ